MKRDFLEALDLGDGVKLPKSAVDAIMAENGKDIEAKNNTITTLTTERDGLKDQLATANDTIKSYKDMDIDGIKANADKWETKYTTDTKALQDQLDAANYGFAVKEAAGGLKFSSKAAQSAFTTALTAKKLPLQDGKLLGMDDFVKSYRDDDPDAFAADDDDNQPIGARGGGGGGNTLGASAALRAAFGLPDKNK